MEQTSRLFDNFNNLSKPHNGDIFWIFGPKNNGIHSWQENLCRVLDAIAHHSRVLVTKKD